MNKARQIFLYIAPFPPLAFFKIWASLGQSLDALFTVACLMLVYCGFVIWLAGRWDRPSYFDWAVAAYFAAVTLSLLLMPETATKFFENYPVTVIYLCLFAAAFLPPLFRFDPFTYHYVKKSSPEMFWGNPIFVKINLIMTYVWACVFALCIGDNVVNASKNMGWYHGPTLLYHLENVYISSDENLVDCRFPVQYVIRPRSDKYHDYRGYAGKIVSGIFKPGDSVMVLPSGFMTTIKSIEESQEVIVEAFPPISVVMQLTEDLDISRGDMLVRPHNIPFISHTLDWLICWMNTKPLTPGTRYIIRHTTKETKGIVNELQKSTSIPSIGSER